MKTKPQTIDIAKIRTAIADYMSSEGCSCCRDHDAHDKHAAVIGKMLSVPEYDDKSGYKFYEFRSKTNEN